MKLHVHFAQALLAIPHKESKEVIWYATREESSRPLIWKRVQVEVIWLAFRPNLLGHSETEDSVIDSLGKWKEHTLSFGEVTRAREAFESYNYEVEEFQMPKSKPLQSLRSKIRASAADIKTTPNLNTLLIIWYYGHGGLSANRGNDLSLCSHRKGGTRMRWSDVTKAILNVRTDVLTILDCCHAGASVISEDILQPFIASNKEYVKWGLTGSGFENFSWSGHTNALAYAIADILDRHLDTMDLDTERLHRQATFRAVATYIREFPLTSTPGLLRMISGRPGPIMLHPLPNTLAPRGTKRSRPFSSTDSVDEPPKTRARAS
ncbi:peptidase s8 [Colletotrichum kahawae]|uniref:Peptidase s8 n=1 Tax=Colletotrichum kahawae TaxID=34407 RepID=A0AAD9YKI5_COLKA|nr:peptidase s8 [Colletotrichum kahawae]